MVKQIKKQNIWMYTVVLIGLLVVAVGVFFSLKTINNSKDEDVIIWTNEDNQDTGGMELVKENVEASTQDDGELKVKQYEGDNPNEAEVLSGVVTFAGVNNERLVIRTSIDQYLTSGLCELTLERNGVAIYNGIVNIGGNATTSACDGFDIDLAGLEEGEVQITIDLSANERVGTIRGRVDL